MKTITKPGTSTTLPGGTFKLADDLILTRVGYGAMQLAGPHVFGPPADHDGALAVLREVVELGINHIDTSDFYGPHITNQLIKEALHQYPEPLRVLAEMRQEGLIKHLGVSTVSAEQVAEAQAIAPVVCVQNFYNIANRQDDPLIDSLAEQGIAYVPYFPLGGFSPLQSGTLSSVAARLDTTPMAVALAWLLQRSPNILLIPGTSSVEHLRENVAGAGLQLPDDAIKELNDIAV